MVCMVLICTLERACLQELDTGWNSARSLCSYVRKSFGAAAAPPVFPPQQMVCHN